MSKTPTPEKAALELRMSARGVLQAYYNGEYLPASQIIINGTQGDRAVVQLVFTGRYAKLTYEPDNIHGIA